MTGGQTGALPICEHRDTALAGLTEQRHQIGKASRVVKGDDVGSRHSDVDHPSFAEMQQVLQHLTLDEAQVALAAAVLVMLLYRFLDLEIGRASCRERVCQYV